MKSTFPTYFIPSHIATCYFENLWKTLYFSRFYFILILMTVLAWVLGSPYSPSLFLAETSWTFLSPQILKVLIGFVTLEYFWREIAFFFRTVPNSWKNSHTLGWHKYSFIREKEILYQFYLSEYLKIKVTAEFVLELYFSERFFCSEYLVFNKIAITFSVEYEFTQRKSQIFNTRFKLRPAENKSNIKLSIRGIKISMDQKSLKGRKSNSVMIWYSIWQLYFCLMVNHCILDQNMNFFILSTNLITNKLCKTERSTFIANP